MLQGRFKLIACASTPALAVQSTGLPIPVFRVVPLDAEGFEREVEKELQREQFPAEHVQRVRQALYVFLAGKRTANDLADAMLSIGALAPAPWAAVVETGPGHYIVFGFYQ